jgi:hypothetical protein
VVNTCHHAELDRLLAERDAQIVELRVALTCVNAEIQRLANDLLIDMSEAIGLADEPIPFAIEPLAARGFLTVPVGRTQSFKSWLMMLLGHAVHSGGGVLGGMRCEPSVALLVDAENGARLLGRRFRAAAIPQDGLLIAAGAKKLPRDFERLSGW